MIILLVRIKTKYVNCFMYRKNNINKYWFLIKITLSFIELDTSMPADTA